MGLFNDNANGAAGQNAATASKRTTRRQGDLASKVAAEQEAALAPNARWTTEQKDAYYYDNIQSLTSKFNALWDNYAALVADNNARDDAHNALADRVEEVVDAHNGLAADVESAAAPAGPVAETATPSRRSRRTEESADGQ